MQPINRIRRRLAPTVVMAFLALAAFGAGSAGAAGGGGKEFVPGVTDFPSRLGEIGERAAEARLAQRSPEPILVEENGFDWSAGVTGAFAAALVLLGAALVVRGTKRTRVALG